MRTKHNKVERLSLNNTEEGRHSWSVLTSSFLILGFFYFNVIGLSWIGLNRTYERLCEVILCTWKSTDTC